MLITELILIIRLSLGINLECFILHDKFSHLFSEFLQVSSSKKIENTNLNRMSGCGPEGEYLGRLLLQ